MTEAEKHGPPCMRYYLCYWSEDLELKENLDFIEKY